MYTKDGQTISGKRIIIEGCVVLNPSEELLEQQGWHKVVPSEPTPARLVASAKWSIIEYQSRK